MLHNQQNLCVLQACGKCVQLSAFHFEPDKEHTQILFANSIMVIFHHISIIVFPICILKMLTLLNSSLKEFVMGVWWAIVSVQFSSVAQSCLTLCDPMNHSMPGLPVHHQLLEFTQIHVHRVSDAIQPSHPLSSPSPPAPNPSQHQSLFQ